MCNIYYHIPITAFALVSFVSIALGNILLGIATLFFLIFLYQKRTVLMYTEKRYYIAITCFICCMLLSALASGDIGKGMKVWSDLWLWRLLPFFIITLSVREINAAKRIFYCSLSGIMFGSLYLIYQGLCGYSRAAGFFGHSMTFAGYFCIFMPVLLITLLDEQILEKRRWLAGFGLAISSLALLFNGTRGAWLAVFVVFLIVLAYYLLQRNKLAMLCLAVLFVCGVALTQYHPFMKRIHTLTDTKYQSNTERILIWNSAWKMFEDHPVLGVGLGQYKDNYQKKYISPKAKEPKLSHAHNNFMQMLAENGVVGFLGFMQLIIFLIGYSLYYFYKERNPYFMMMSMSTLALVLQGFTEYNFGNSAVMKSFWLLQGCLLVLAADRRK